MMIVAKQSKNSQKAKIVTKLKIKGKFEIKRLILADFSANFLATLAEI